MSLSDLAALGSFVSGVAVLVSLVYVSFQIRQNTLHQRASMQQGRAARNVDLMVRTAEPQFAAIMLRGRQADAALEPAELEQFLRTMTAIFLNFEDGFLQAQSGMLDQASFASDTEALRKHIFPHAGYRVAWTMLKAGMQPAFCAYMDAILRETPVIHARDRATVWKALIVESTGAATEVKL